MIKDNLKTEKSKACDEGDYRIIATQKQNAPTNRYIKLLTEYFSESRDCEIESFEFYNPLKN